MLTIKTAVVSTSLCIVVAIVYLTLPPLTINAAAEDINTKLRRLILSIDKVPVATEQNSIVGSTPTGNELVGELGIAQHWKPIELLVPLNLSLHSTLMQMFYGQVL